MRRITFPEKLSVGGVVLAAALFAAAFLPFVVDAYLLRVATVALIWSYAASAWNVAGGYAGQLSLGHGLYFGAGAYGMGYLYETYELSPVIGMAVGALVSIVIAVAVAYVSFRTQLGHLAFAILTLVLSLMALRFAAGSEALGRQAGLFIPVGRDEPLNLFFESQRTYYWLALVMVALIALYQVKLLRSRSGQYWVAMRDNEAAATAVGVNLLRERLASNAASAALTAFGGGLYFLVVGFIDPASVFGIVVTINLLLFAVVGGLGTVSGPIIGASLLVVAAELIRSRVGVGLSGLNQAVYGSAVILIVLLLPAGLVSLPSRLSGRFSNGVARRSPAIQQVEDPIQQVEVDNA